MFLRKVLICLDGINSRGCAFAISPGFLFSRSIFPPPFSIDHSGHAAHLKKLSLLSFLMRH